MSNKPICPHSGNFSPSRHVLINLWLIGFEYSKWWWSIVCLCPTPWREQFVSSAFVWLFNSKEGERKDANLLIGIYRERSKNTVCLEIASMQFLCLWGWDRHTHRGYCMHLLRKHILSKNRIERKKCHRNMNNCMTLQSLLCFKACNVSTKYFLTSLSLIKAERFLLYWGWVGRENKRGKQKAPNSFFSMNIKCTWVNESTCTECLKS